MKEWLIRLTLIAFGFIIAIVALEFGLSKFAPHYRVRRGDILHEYDEHIGWKGIPRKDGYHVDGEIISYVKINSHGFRDKERNYGKEKGVFRMVVLGDSMTEGKQVSLEQTFPYILEKRLNSESSSGSPTSLPLDRYHECDEEEHSDALTQGIRRPCPAYSSDMYPRSQRFEVINLGIAGFGTAQEYLTLKHYGLKYQPDLVILAFFIGNDVSNNSLILESEYGPNKRPFFVLNKGKLEYIPIKIKFGNPSKDEEQTKRGVTLAKFFPNIYYSLIDRINGTPWLGNFLWNLGIKKSKPKELLDRAKKEIHYVYAEEYTPEWQNAWEVTKALILKLAKELEMDEIGFLVVIIPREFEFRPDRWNKTLDEYPYMRALKYDLKKPERILSKFLETNNIDYLLLRPEFEKYSKETGKDLHLHYAYDNHWNANGHALAAESIYKKLKDDKLVLIKGENKQ